MKPEVRTPSRCCDWIRRPTPSWPPSTLPPTQVLTAGFDPLRDEGLALADAIEKAGVPVERVSFDGQMHGFARSMAQIPEALDALDGVAKFLRAKLAGEGARESESATFGRDVSAHLRWRGVKRDG